MEEQGVLSILLSMLRVFGGEPHLQDFSGGFTGGVLDLLFGGLGLWSHRERGWEIEVKCCVW